MDRQTFQERMQQLRSTQRTAQGLAPVKDVSKNMRKALFEGYEARKTRAARIQKEDEQKAKAEKLEKAQKAMDTITQDEYSRLKPEEITALSEAYVAGNADKIEALKKELFGRVHPSNAQRARDLGKSLVGGIVSPIKKTGQSIASLTGTDTTKNDANQAQIRYEQAKMAIDARMKYGGLSKEEGDYLKQQALQRELAEFGQTLSKTEWAGTKGNRTRIAAGVATEAGFDIATMGSVRGAKLLALGLAKAGAKETAEQYAVDVAKREFLRALETGTTKGILKQGAKTAGVAAGFGLGEAMQGDEFTAKEARTKMAIGGALGFAFGVTIPILGKTYAKYLEKRLSKPIKINKRYAKKQPGEVLEAVKRGEVVEPKVYAAAQAAERKAVEKAQRGQSGDFSVWDNFVNKVSRVQV